jgi:fumarate hydratase class II
MELMEYVEGNEDTLIKIVRTHQYQTNVTLIQTVKNFKKFLQSDIKQINNILAQNIKEKWEEERMDGQFLHS